MSMPNLEALKYGLFPHTRGQYTFDKQAHHTKKHIIKMRYTYTKPQWGTYKNELNTTPRKYKYQLYTTPRKHIIMQTKTNVENWYLLCEVLIALHIDTYSGGPFYSPDPVFLNFV